MSTDKAPYGTVIIDGEMYPAIAYSDMTRFEADLIKFTIRNAKLIVKALRSINNNDEADEMERLYQAIEDEGGTDFWEERK